MRFRPCIDIHNGKVKQIVGGSLKDERDQAEENFVSERSAAFYADMFRRDNLKGGHMILLNPPSSPYFEADRQQAAEALAVWPIDKFHFYDHSLRPPTYCSVSSGETP